MLWVHSKRRGLRKPRDDAKGKVPDSLPAQQLDIMQAKQQTLGGVEKIPRRVVAKARGFFRFISVGYEPDRGGQIPVAGPEIGDVALIAPEPIRRAHYELGHLGHLSARIRREDRREGVH